jgi:hypothetical protein
MTGKGSTPDLQKQKIQNFEMVSMSVGQGSDVCTMVLCKFIQAPWKFLSRSLMAIAVMMVVLKKAFLRSVHICG